MKYVIFWLDATLVSNYKSEKHFIASYASEGVKVEITQVSDWYDFDARHEFESDNDTLAIEYCKKWLDNYHRVVEVFSLCKDRKVIFTEEDTEEGLIKDLIRS